MRIAGIDQKRDARKLRSDGFQEFQPLGCEVTDKIGQAGHVPARSRQARGKAACYRIAHRHEDDRDRRRGPLGSAGRIGGRSKIDIDFRAHQFRSQIGEPIVLAVGIAFLKDKILPFGMAKLLQSQSEFREVRLGVRSRSRIENTDPENPSPSLAKRSERCTKHRSDGSQELAPLHSISRSGML